MGQSYRDTNVDAIYASDLLRALWTVCSAWFDLLAYPLTLQAQQIEKNQPEPKPHMTVSALLREQNFGEAERKPFGEKGGYVRQPGRTFKFPQGESLEDVRARANEARVSPPPCWTRI